MGRWWRTAPSQPSCLSGTGSLRRRVTIYTSMVCETSPDTVGFTGGSIPLYTVVTGAASVTSYADNRTWVAPGYLPSNGSIMVTAADVDLTAAVNADKARCSYLTTTGALTANRNVIVPNSWQAIVFCNNSGAFTTTFKTAAGAGVVVAQGKRAMLLADGTNVVRVTPDT